MYSPEETQSQVSYQNLTLTESQTSIPPSSVHLLRLNEEVMPRSEAIRLDQQELELDLRAFELRLQELAKATKPCSFHWIPISGSLLACTAVSACHWLPELGESESIVLRCLASRGALTLSLATMVLTIFLGARHIIQRPPGAMELLEETLARFQMQCDSDGQFVRIPPTEPHPARVRGSR